MDGWTSTGSKQVHEEKVKTTVSGYIFRGQTFPSPSRLINWFKSHAMDALRQQNQPRSLPASGEPPAYQPGRPPPNFNRSGGPPGQQPAPPVQWGMGSSQAPVGPPSGAPPAWGGSAQGAPPPAYVPRNNSGPPGMPPPPNQAPDSRGAVWFK